MEKVNEQNGLALFVIILQLNFFWNQRNFRYPNSCQPKQNKKLSFLPQDLIIKQDQDDSLDNSFKKERPFSLKLNSDQVIITPLLGQQIDKYKKSIKKKYMQQYIRSFSHNLRHPCTHIQYLCQYLLKQFELNKGIKQQNNDSGSSSERKQGYSSNDILQIVLKIQDANQDLLYMTQRFLDYSEIQANGFQLQRKTFEVEHLIQEALSKKENEINEKNINIEMEINKECSRIYSDFSRVFVIFIKLLHNAIKFSHDGGRIIISVKEKVPLKIKNLFADKKIQKYKFVKIEIKDFGVGIPESIQDSIFRIVFDKIDETRIKRAHLGLPICNAIAKKLGRAEIEFKSKPLEGSKFSFYIQQKISKIQEHMNNQISIGQPKETRKILIVDDIQMIRFFLKEILQEENIELFEAIDGQEAVEIFQQYQVDYFQSIIMDCDMPRMNGWEATKEIRNKGYQGLIIGHTAFSSSEDNSRCIKAGMNVVLTKPTSKQDLLSAIEGNFN